MGPLMNEACGTGLGDELASLAALVHRSTVQVLARGAGAGSGVVWRSDGTVVTNAHVARGARATVHLSDGRSVEAAVTARDERRDLAVLTLEGAQPSCATIGDSDTLRAGELVFAVGHPLGLAGAVTAGIVHAPASPEARGLARWVRADVRLAPGNSGGPLADARGRVIGVNSMIVNGLALAIPSNAVERFLRRGATPRLGVQVRPVIVSEAKRRAFGALVLDVAPGSAAAAAGLLPGDVVIGAAGRRFEAPDTLLRILDAALPGETLALELMRGSDRVRRDVAFGAAAPKAA